MIERAADRKRVPLPGHATVVAYLALFVALGGGAYAIGSKPATSTINGCYSRHTGALRIVAKNGRCHKRELPVSWNKQGPTGPAGPAGPRGAEGPEGKVSTAGFYTKEQADARYLPVGGTAANASTLAGQPPSAFASSSLFGSPVAVSETGESNSSQCTVGQILLTPDSVIPAGTVLAHGQLLKISENTALFSLIGTTYGGDGKTNFALPDLRGAEPKGKGPAGANYVICLFGVFP